MTELKSITILLHKLDIPKYFLNKIYIHKKIPFFTIDHSIKNLRFFTKRTFRRSCKYYYVYDTEKGMLYKPECGETISGYCINDELCEAFPEYIDEGEAYINYLKNKETKLKEGDVMEEFNIKFIDKEAFDDYYEYIKKEELKPIPVKVEKIQNDDSWKLNEIQMLIKEEDKKIKEKKAKTKKEKTEQKINKQQREKAIFEMIINDIVDEARFKELIGEKITLPKYTKRYYIEYLNHYNMEEYEINTRRRKIIKKN
jgi:hypothetical protein